MLTFVGARRKTSALSFSPDGSRLAAGGGDAPIEVWDVAARSVVARADVPIGHFSDAIRFDPTGRWLVASGPGTGLVAHELAGGAVRRMAESEYAMSFALAPDATRIVYFNYRLSQLRLLGLTPDFASSPAWAVRLDPTSSGASHCIAVEFLPDGERLVTAEFTYGTDRTNRLSVRSSATGEVLATAPFPAAFPEGMAVSPAGDRAVVRAGMSLYGYDLADLPASPEKVTNDNRRHFTGLAFHPSGKYLAATSNDASVKLYDTQTWRVERAFTWKVGKLRSVAFTADGTLAAAGSINGKVVVWDLDL